MLAGVVSACLVNIGVAVRSTRAIDGPQPRALEERYGELRQHFGETSTAAYVTGNGWRFLNARYALAPVVFDHRFVVLEDDGRTIAGFDLDAMTSRAQDHPPLVVLCDFDRPKELTSFLGDLSARVQEGGLELRVVQKRRGLALVELGG